jgi:hypothetical protein
LCLPLLGIQSILIQISMLGITPLNQPSPPTTIGGCVTTGMCLRAGLTQLLRPRCTLGGAISAKLGRTPGPAPAIRHPGSHALRSRQFAVCFMDFDPVTPGLLPRVLPWDIPRRSCGRRYRVCPGGRAENWQRPSSPGMIRPRVVGGSRFRVWWPA